MWSTEYAAETDLDADAVWTALRDLHSGTVLGERGDRFELHGPFAVGTSLSVTPHGQDTLRSTIIELRDHEVYADETIFDGLRLVFRHRLTPLAGGGTRVVHQLVIDGEGADQAGPELGRQISADFPDAMAELLAAAAGRPAPTLPE